MKVMYVCKIFAEWGGLERVWTDKMNALTRLSGYEVLLVTTEQGTHPFPFSLSSAIVHRDLAVPFTSQYRHRGIKRWCLKWQNIRLFRERLKALLEETKPDLLVSNASVYADMLVRWKRQTPLVVECHGIYDRPFHMLPMTPLRRLQAWLHRRAVSKANAVVALTRQDADRWRQCTPNVYVIPDMVHVNTSDDTCDSSAKRIIFAGRADAQKGFSYLARVWSIVSQRHPDWQLHVYGEGFNHAQGVTEELKGERLFLHGRTDRIFDCYKSSSILILTSVYEPFGLVMPEAMSCGLPVVSFNCPYGPAAIIADGEDGFLVECFNVEAFADKLSQLMADENLRRQMGRQAKIAARRYTQDKVLPQWLALYEKLTTKHYNS